MTLDEVIEDLSNRALEAIEMFDKTPETNVAKRNKYALLIFELDRALNLLKQVDE